jgi:hypothetical protein
MARLTWLSAVAATPILAACGTSADAKHAFESYAMLQIGKPASYLDARVECGEGADGYGCMRTDLRGCKAWFAVDRSSGRITTWRYEEPKERCWKRWGLQ